MTADGAVSLHNVPGMHKMVLYTSLESFMIRLICRSCQTTLYLVCPQNLLTLYKPTWICAHMHMCTCEESLGTTQNRQALHSATSPRQLHINLSSTSSTPISKISFHLILMHTSQTICDISPHLQLLSGQAMASSV